MNKEIKIQRLIEKIQELPKGTLTTKKVKNRVYYYHRWYENKTRKEKYIPKNDVKSFSNKLSLRKKLEKELKELDISAYLNLSDTPFKTSLRFNDTLRLYAFPAKEYTLNDNFYSLSNFLYKNNYCTIAIITGNKGDGKTSLIRQALLHMNSDDLLKTALISLNNTNTIQDLENDIKILKQKGARYIFIDNVTSINMNGIQKIFDKKDLKFILTGSNNLNNVFNNCVKINL